jgi:hypothetical protein
MCATHKLIIEYNASVIFIYKIAYTQCITAYPVINRYIKLISTYMTEGSNVELLLSLLSLLRPKITQSDIQYKCCAYIITLIEKLMHEKL